jgi:hypothetical protein
MSVRLNSAGSSSFRAVAILALTLVCCNPPCNGTQRVEPPPVADASSPSPRSDNAVPGDVMQPGDVMPASGPMTIDVPADTPAPDLAALVLAALRGPRRCWVVWGGYPSASDTRPILFRGPDGGTIGLPAQITCPSPDAADFVNTFGAVHIKTIGLAYFREDHFEYKASLAPEVRLTAALIVTPQSGLALDMLSRMEGVTKQCRFAYLRSSP